MNDTPSFSQRIYEMLTTALLLGHARKGIASTLRKAVFQRFCLLHNHGASGKQQQFVREFSA